jgi:hypothetical protein
MWILFIRDNLFIRTLLVIGMGVAIAIGARLLGICQYRE